MLNHLKVASRRESQTLNIRIVNFIVDRVVNSIRRQRFSKLPLMAWLTALAWLSRASRLFLGIWLGNIA